MPSPLEPPRPLDGVACPYPGPRPFWRKDSGCFFGRDRERADLANLALTYPVTVLYAQSGNGKTSLLEAGLASRVAREGARVLSARVGAETPPGAGRERPFSMALLGTIREDDKLLAAGAQLERWSAAPLCGALAEVLEAIGLVSPARSGPGPGGRRASAEDRLELEAPVILVVDQFEELFTTNLPQWGARRDFLNDLGAATRRIRDLHVVLAIREDYLAELDPYAPLMPDGLRIRYRLERLRQAQAIEAITGPLATLGVDLDHSLTSRVVRDLLRTRAADRSAGGVEYDGEFAEPVHVQVACQQLWEDLRGASPDAPVGSPSGESAARESAQFGFRVHGRRFVCAPTATRGIDEALAQMYRSALRRAAREASTPEGKIRRFADHELITEAGTRNLASLDDFERAGLAKAAADVLVDERVLHRELRRGMAWYELTHDRFVEPIRRDNAAWAARRRRPLIASGVAVGSALLVASAFGAYWESSRLHKNVEATLALATVYDVPPLTSQAASGGPSAPALVDSPPATSDVSKSLEDDPAAAVSAVRDALNRSLDQSQRNLQELRLELAQARSEAKKAEDDLARVQGELDAVTHDRDTCLKSGKPVAPPSPALAVAPAPLPPLGSVVTPLARVQAIAGSSKRRFFASLFVPRERVSDVVQVDYLFDHPSFNPKVLSSTNAHDNFEVSYVGWGCLHRVQVTLRLTGGRQAQTAFDMCHALGFKEQ